MHDTTIQRGFLQAVPNILWQQQRWIRWLDKRPIAWDSDRWTSYHDQKQWRAGVDVTPPKMGGVGFSFSKPVEVDGHQLLAFDLDACRNAATGKLEPWAKDFVIRCGKSYTEITPSGQGLRVFVLVKNLPEMHQSEWKPLASTRAPGTTKTVECQVFGGGCVGYVTVTGKQLLGSLDEIVTLENLDFWSEVFGQPIDAGVGRSVGEAGAWDGKGFGDAPTLAEVKAVVRSTPAGVALMDCAWKGNPALNGLADKSNSEAFAALEGLVVKAARWHREVAVKFLLRECPRWADPGVRECYSREDWVRKDLARVAPTKPAFEPLPDEQGASSPEVAGDRGTTAAINTDGLLLPAGEFARGAAQQMFLVKNLIARTGVTQFFGDPASGKTPFVMSLAIAIASGAPTWFGRKVLRHGLVVYMVGEDRAGVGHRLLAECKARGLDVDELGKNLLFTTKPGQLMSPEDTQRWILAIQRAAAGREVAFVAIDTQAQNFGPGDENAFKDMNQFLHNLESMTGILDAAIGTVHHTGHANKERGRGHSAMEGFLTSRFEVVKSELENGTIVTVATDHKHKNWEKPEPLRGTLVPVLRFVDEDGDQVTAITLQEQGASIFENEEDVEKVVAVLADRGPGMSVRGLATAMEKHHRDAGKALRKAVAMGFVTETKAKNGRISYPVTALGLEMIRKGSVQVRQKSWRTPFSDVSAPSEMAHLGAPKLDKSVTDALD